MKEYKINELFQYDNRTLMCVEGVNCEECKFEYAGRSCEGLACNAGSRSDSKYIHFTNKLIFSAEGIKLQIKRKGAKVKVKVLELSEEFDSINNDEFTIYKSNIVSNIDYYNLGIYEVKDKVKYKFPTEQEAIDWVEALFSLRGDA